MRFARGMEIAYRPEGGPSAVTGRLIDARDHRPITGASAACRLAAASSQYGGLGWPRAGFASSGLPRRVPADPCGSVDQRKLPHAGRQRHPRWAGYAVAFRAFLQHQSVLSRAAGDAAHQFGHRSGGRHSGLPGRHGHGARASGHFPGCHLHYHCAADRQRRCAHLWLATHTGQRSHRAAELAAAVHGRDPDAVAIVVFGNCRRHRLAARVFADDGAAACVRSGPHRPAPGGSRAYPRHARLARVPSSDPAAQPARPGRGIHPGVFADRRFLRYARDARRHQRPDAGQSDRPADHGDLRLAVRSDHRHRAGGDRRWRQPCLDVRLLDRGRHMAA